MSDDENDSVASPIYEHTMGDFRNDMWNDIDMGEMDLVAEPVYLKHGMYFVGDVCLVLTDHEKEDLFSQLAVLNKHGERTEGKIELKSRRTLVVFHTLGTIGQHFDEEGKPYIFFSGILGIVEDTFTNDVLSMKGQLFRFDNEFSCYCHEGWIPDLKKSIGYRTRIVQFGERVKFILHNYETNRHMHLVSDGRYKKKILWQDENHQVEGEHLANVIVRGIQQLHKWGR